MIEVALFAVVVLVFLTWFMLEYKRLKHRIFAIFLIVIILFMYFSFLIAFKGKEIDYKSVSGIIEAGKVYMNWLFFASGNFKSITTNAIQMDWKGNITEE